MYVQEIFKDIPGYEGSYQVSNLGRVKSLSRVVKKGTLKERILKSSPDRQGYLRVNLYKKGNKKTEKIHILMAIVFKGHLQSGYEGLIVDHIDNIKINNFEWNIQLITNRENTSKDRKNGTSKYIGVYRSENQKKWRSNIYFNGKLKYLGSFTSELEAAGAYQTMLKEITESKKLKIS